MLSSCLIAKEVLGLGLGLLWRMHVVLGVPSLATWQAIALTASDRFPFNAGTGFFVSATGDFVSAAHVIGDCPLPAVVTPEGLTIGTDVVVANGGDVAVMRTTFHPRSFATFPTYTEQGWHPVAIARFVGCGGMPSFSLADAIAIDTMNRLPGILPVAAERPIMGGNSGSPVIDAQGNVIGLVVARGIEFTHYGLAVDAPAIVMLLRHADRDFTAMGRGLPGSYIGQATLAADYTFPVACLY